MDDKKVRSASVLVISILMTGLLAFALCGCSNQTTSTPAAADSEDDSRSTIRTITSVVESGSAGFWIEDADTKGITQISSVTMSDSYDLDKAYTGSSPGVNEEKREEVLSYFADLDSFISGQSGSDMYKAGVRMFDLASDDIPHISKQSGDRLLFTSSNSSDSVSKIWLSSVAGIGYHQKENMSGDPSRYDELDGSSVKDSKSREEFINDHGLFYLKLSSSRDSNTKFLCSKTKTTFDAGWHDGTAYKSGSLPLTVPYITLSDSSYWVLSRTINCPVESTKEGYSVIDFSSAAPGLYSVYLYDTKQNSVFYLDA